MDASQEMFALGVCNIAASFVQSMPITGSFSRTAVNCASGVKTQAGGLFTGALVMVCLACLMEYCAFIPKVVFVFVFHDVCVFAFPIDYCAFIPKVFKSTLNLHLLNFASSTRPFLRQ